MLLRRADRLGAVMTDKEYRALVGFNARQGRHHSVVSRLITFDRVMMLVVVGVVLGIFGCSYVTAAHHLGQMINDALAHAGG